MLWILYPNGDDKTDPELTSWWFLKKNINILSFFRCYLSSILVILETKRRRRIELDYDVQVRYEFRFHTWGTYDLT